MGVDIRAKMICGLWYDDIPEDLQEAVDEVIEGGTLDYASTEYDAPKNEWVVGVEVRVNGRPAHKIQDVILDSMYGDGVPECYKELNRRGLLGVYVVPHVY